MSVRITSEHARMIVEACHHNLGAEVVLARPDAVAVVGLTRSLAQTVIDLHDEIATFTEFHRGKVDGLNAEIERLRRLLAVERGDASAAPSGWRGSGSAFSSMGHDLKQDHYVNRITPGLWEWVSRSNTNKVYGRGRADTALEAMEAADRAARVTP